MAKACACKKPAECEECPEWIFTFADLVMLMMGFFVILFVLKPEGKPAAGAASASPSEQKWLDTVGEIRSAMGYVPDPNSHDPVDMNMLRTPKPGNKEGNENEVPRDSAKGVAQQTTTVRPGNYSLVGGRIGFDKGSLQLMPEFAKALDGLAEKIKGHMNIVMVKGHSALDEADESPDKLMDLSLRRAQAVASYLISKGVNPEVLRVEGCSTFEPVRERVYDPNGQADNRRVEVESTSELITDRRDSSKTPAAPIDENADPAKKQEQEKKE